MIPDGNCLFHAQFFFAVVWPLRKLPGHYIIPQALENFHLVKLLYEKVRAHFDLTVPQQNECSDTLLGTISISTATFVEMVA